MGTLALGYGFGNGIRVELEGSIRANAVDSARGFAPLQPLERAQGELWNYGVMANAFVDLNLGQPGWVQPYLGLGLGYVHTELTNFRVNGNSARLAVDSSDGSLAYQAIAGAAFPIEAVPGLSATAEYRFMGVVGSEFRARLVDASTSASFATGRAEVEPYHHAVLVGLRYQPASTGAADGDRCWWRPR
jgi:opacity protein-like surface antigen